MTVDYLTVADVIFATLMMYWFVPMLDAIRQIFVNFINDEDRNPILSRWSFPGLFDGAPVEIEGEEEVYAYFFVGTLLYGIFALLVSLFWPVLLLVVAVFGSAFGMRRVKRIEKKLEKKDDS